VRQSGLHQERAITANGYISVIAGMFARLNRSCRRVGIDKMQTPGWHLIRTTMTEKSGTDIFERFALGDNSAQFWG
jgi:hypothetical protein